MAYIKQDWNGYNEALSVEDNIRRHAVVMPEYMDHIEDGIVEVDRKSFDTVEVQTVEHGEKATAEVIDGTLHLTIPAGPAGESIVGEQGEKGDPGETGADGADGHSMGVCSTEPDSTVIAADTVQGVSRAQDCFITPSGKIYTIAAVGEGTYSIADTGIVLTGGKDGEQGEPGKDGADGKSAYEVAVDAGFTGTEEEWVESLKGDKGDPGEAGAAGTDGVNGADGADGKSAYDIAVENGFEGSEEEWIASLKGTDGVNGKSAYEIAVENGFTGTVEEWLEQVGVGEVIPGANGKSAYDIAVEKGFEGTEEEWVASLKGDKGDPGEPGSDGEQGIAGADGADGKSAYDIAVENGFDGDEATWLSSLKGESGEAGTNGTDGADGKSAYDIAVENGFEGSEEEWIASLKGESGEAGTNGTDGADGFSIGVASIEPDSGIISKESVKSVGDAGDHFVAPSGRVYAIEDLDETDYMVTATDVDLKGPKGDANSEEVTGGGFSIGISVVEPVNGEIAVADVTSAAKVGDHFISPSGCIYKISEVQEGKYMAESTNVNISENFKGNAIGHCSDLAVEVINDNSESPQLSVTYTDPANEGVPFGGTIVAVKEDALPESPEDADIIEDTMDKDLYKTNPLVIDIPRSDKLQRTFHVALFPYSASGVRNMLKKEREQAIMNWVEKAPEIFKLLNISAASEIFRMDDSLYCMTADNENDTFVLNQINIDDFSLSQECILTDSDDSSSPRPSKSSILDHIILYDDNKYFLFNDGTRVMYNNGSISNYSCKAYNRDKVIGYCGGLGIRHFDISTDTVTLTNVSTGTTTNLSISNVYKPFVLREDGSVAQVIGTGNPNPPYISGRNSYHVLFLDNGNIITVLAATVQQESNYISILNSSSATGANHIAKIADIDNWDRNAVSLIGRDYIVIASILSSKSIKLTKYKIVHRDSSTFGASSTAPYIIDESSWVVDIPSVDNVKIYVDIINSSRYLVSVRDLSTGELIWSAIENETIES